MCKRLFIIMILISQYGCISYTKINQDELLQVANNAREFVLGDGTIFTLKDKEIIKNEAPQLSVYYTGKKYGQFFLKWDLTQGKQLTVIGNGYLLKKKSLHRRLVSGSDPNGGNLKGF